jgi:hypothetical protein
MDINYTEYDDNLNSNEEFDYNKYWEEPPKTEKKKKVSFNDILSNMNLVVGKNGVLQKMRNHVEDPLLQQQYLPPQQQQYLPPQQQYLPPQQQQYLPPQQQQYIPPQNPVEPAVKHSYIYNKYFKDYNDNFQPEPKVLIPKTIEEYRQMVQEERQKILEERNRIAQIKSTKLMFTTNQGYNVNNTKPTTIKPSKNSLRSMNFR